MNDELLTPAQDAKTNPTLEFRDGQCLLSMNTLAGTKIEHFVSWEAVREAATGIPIDTGWLTTEIVRCGKGGKGEWCVAFIPPGRHKLELTYGTPGTDEKIEYVTAPLPGLVFFGMDNHYFVWAQKTARCEPQHELFRCPLPNVMIDASVCWGLLKPPNASPRTMLKAWELFITSTFNNHSASSKSKSHKEDVRELLKDLSHDENSIYPVADLQRQVAQTGVTLDRAVRHWFELGAMPQ
jgi:PRTRC genetic system protein B